MSFKPSLKKCSRTYFCEELQFEVGLWREVLGHVVVSYILHHNVCVIELNTCHVSISSAHGC